MDYLGEHRILHAELIRPVKGKPVGCPPEDILELEREIGFELPEAYRQYILWMGRDYNGIFVGSDWFLGDALENTKYLPDLLQENDIDFPLPANFLAFFGHQGYMSAWFNLPKESDDPPVYFFTEEKEQRPPISLAYSPNSYTETCSTTLSSHTGRNINEILSPLTIADFRYPLKR